MTMKDYQYDYEWDAYYCYPKRNVLINKLNIKDPTALLLAEREITAFKIARAKKNAVELFFGKNSKQYKSIKTK